MNKVMDNRMLSVSIKDDLEDAELMKKEDDYTNQINDIVNALFKGRFSVFCGAGAVADINNTELGWIDLFSDEIKSFYEKGYSSDIYFLADLEKRYKNANFLADIRKKLLDNSNSKSKHISNIVNLNINQIWTTNFDCVIENTVSRKLKIKPTVISNSTEILKNGLDAPYTIFKLNGSIDDTYQTEPGYANRKDTMVLTKTDFFNYFEKQRLLFEILKRQLVLDTFLFIGYSFSDDLVLSALREIKKTFPAGARVHYRFQQKKSEELQEFMKLESQYFEEEYNIKTIWVDKFTEIDDYLQKIYHKFCQRNIFIAGSFRQLRGNEERKYIEHLVDSLIEKLINRGFRIYSGNGRGLGEIVVAQIDDKQATNQFVNRPLIFTGDPQKEKKHKNKLIMKDCSTMIVICGQDDSLLSSKNVMKQFSTFTKHTKGIESPLVIPLPTTGYAAKDIYCKKSFKKSSIYRTNKAAFKKLEVPDIDNIANVVVNLIQSYKGGIHKL